MTYRNITSFITNICCTEEVADSIYTIVNPLTPHNKKIMAIARLSCCSAAVVTSYMAKYASNPIVKESFELCCLASSYLSRYFRFAQ